MPFHLLAVIPAIASLFKIADSASNIYKNINHQKSSTLLHIIQQNQPQEANQPQAPNTQVIAQTEPNISQA